MKHNQNVLLRIQPMALLYCLLLFAGSANAQLTYDWGITGGNSQNPENSSNETIFDANGYRYTIGTYNGTVDFNPNGTPYTLSAMGPTDIFIAKYYPDGQIIWAKSLGGTSDCFGYHINLANNDQDLVIGGMFDGLVDFDLSPLVQDTFYLNSSGAGDMFVARYDTSGAFQWADQFACGTIGTRWLSEVAIDQNGMIYAYGNFDATVDFDPDPVATNYISSVSFGIRDLFIARLTPTGALDYVNTIGTATSQLSADLLLDNNGHYYISGKTGASTIDFDPGPGTADFTITSVDGFVMKYALDGTYIDGMILSGPSNWDRTSAMDINEAGDKLLIVGDFIDSMNLNPMGTPFYVHGMGNVGSEDIYFGIYNTSLDLLHGFAIGAQYNDDIFGGIFADSDDHIMLWGKLNQNNPDLDPSPYVQGIPQNQSTSAFLAKYDSLGNYLYSYQYEGLGSKNIQDLDIQGNKILLSGKYYNEIDLDLGAGVDLHDSPGNGFYLFNAQYTECSGDYFFDEVMICAGDSSLIHGSYESTTGVYYDNYTNGNGCDSIYRTILVVDTLQLNLGPDLDICESDTVQLQAGTAYSSYLWNDGSAGNQYQFIGDAGSGNFTVDLVVNTNSGCTYEDTVEIYVKPAANVNLGPDISLCENESVTLNAGSFPAVLWSDGTNSSVNTFDADSGAGSFTLDVWVTTIEGCYGYDTINITVNAEPYVDLGGDTTICSYHSLTINGPSGMASYLWQDNSTNSSFTLDGQVTGTGTSEVVLEVSSSEGCANADTVLVTVDPCLALDEMTDETITLYPNPTSGEVNVDFGAIDVTELNVYSASGQIVYSRTLDFSTQSLQFSLSVDKGVYYVHVKTATDHEYIQKLVLY